MSDDDEDIPVLSRDTLAALQDFYTERHQELDAFEQLRSTTQASHGDKSSTLSISLFKEDWNASQFWFTDAAAEYLAKQLLIGITTWSTIAIVSAPSVFIQLRNLLSSGHYPTPARICLLEYDPRFELLEGFIKFDFHKPTGVPTGLKHTFDTVLIDPPYHSRECILKYAEAVEWLEKASSATTERRRIVCTGETMNDIVLGAFPGVQRTTFEPQHTVRLDNRYACFADSVFL